MYILKNFYFFHFFFLFSFQFTRRAYIKQYNYSLLQNTAILSSVKIKTTLSA